MTIRSIKPVSSNQCNKTLVLVQNELFVGLVGPNLSSAESGLGMTSKCLFLLIWERKRSTKSLWHNSHVYFSSADVILWFDHTTYSQITYEPKDEIQSNKVFPKKWVIWIEAQWIFLVDIGPMEGSSIFHHSNWQFFSTHNECISVVQSHVIPLHRFSEPKNLLWDNRILYMVPTQFWVLSFLMRLGHLPCWWYKKSSMSWVVIHKHRNISCRQTTTYSMVCWMRLSSTVQRIMKHIYNCNLANPSESHAESESYFVVRDTLCNMLISTTWFCWFLLLTLSFPNTKNTGLLED